MIGVGKLVRANLREAEKFIDGYTSIEGFFYRRLNANSVYECVIIKKTDLKGIVIDFWPNDGKYIQFSKVLLEKKPYWFRTEDLEEVESIENIKNERHKQKSKKSKE